MGLSNKRSKYKGIITKEVVMALEQEEKLAKLSKKIKVSEKEKQEKDVMINKGIEFSENNIPLEMVPDELKNHHFFKVGYNIGERRKLINNVQKGNVK